MQTRKLFYEDSHLSVFRATVLDCRQAEHGWAVILDATAFYPEGGGQAGDTGTLSDAMVLDTRESEGQVLHFCNAPLTPGTAVTGRIDYAARFLRMQQHSGEHIVSGILHRIYGCSNTGFHMGKHTTQIDFDAVIPAEDLMRIEQEANQAVWQDLQVNIWTPAPDELAELTYRTKRALPWPVRIVEFPGYDRCACCGTHVSRTGEIGLIKLFSAVPFRGVTRIEMACGSAALAVLNNSYEQCRSISQLCSVPIADTAEGVRQLSDQLARAKYRIIQLQRQQFAHTAAACAGKGDLFLVDSALEGNALRELTDALSGSCKGIAAVFSGSDEAGFSYCLMQPGGDLRQLGKALNAACQGRGGGKPECQQGSVRAEAAAIRSFFAERAFTEIFC